MNSYIITGTGKITITKDWKFFTVDTTHKNYNLILEAVKTGNFEGIEKLIDISETVKQYVNDGNGISLDNGIITYNGIEIHNTLTDRIIRFMNEGLPFQPLLNFLGNLVQNPSHRAVNELYNFLEVGELPITEDGCFLAFKNVRSDYMDIYSGTKRNMVGDKPSMPRFMVDDNKDQTCSKGLHFCSIKYLPHFSDSDGGRTMILKINPKDVVSIPSDYNNTKGRCCYYEVVAEYTDNWRERVKNDGDNGFDADLYSSDGGDWDEDDFEDEDEEEIYGTKPSGHKFYNKRGADGKFC